MTARPGPESRSQRVATHATTIAAIGALVVSGFGMVFTARSVDVAADSATATREQVTLLRQGQIADRFARAVDQLGSEEINVRFGAIYSLERLMRESPGDRDTIIQVLCGFVRQKTRKPSGGLPPAPSMPPVPRIPVMATDIQAALTVLGRRDSPEDTGYLIDLSGTDLRRADLHDLDFNHADFSSASLVSARLSGARFEGAKFAGADASWSVGQSVSFRGADLDDARLFWSSLLDADFTAASAWSADLNHSKLTRSKLTEADFKFAIMSDVQLFEAELGGASFYAADLQGARFRGSQHAETADFSCARLERVAGLSVGIVRPGPASDCPPGS
ncbi:pentapeptide repeat-containing protein [Micromonospora sp. DT227]|uniref:pentapeptide repeat-containing protein n=1 Tax=Micromonospora sp. DT227 TaxID=3393433 RepID=UPI003CFA147F